ncbi:MAG TPA: sulfite oxidase [Nitrososphaeraceae archaeon]|nr:sulfite oxidase [Nitrososphaeraceae archaeon]
MVQKLGHLYITLFLIGLVAGAIAIAVSLVQRMYFGGIFIPELASQTLFSLTPGEVESQAVETFGPIAKYSAFIGALIVNLVAYGLLGIFIHKLREKIHPSASYLTNAAISSIISYVVIFIIVFILLTLADIEIQSVSVQSIIMYLILPHVAFGFALAYFYRSVKRTPSILGTKEAPPPPSPSTTTTAATTSTSTPEVDYKKRLLLKAGIASAVVIPFMYIGLNNILFPREGAQSPLPLESELESKPRPAGFEDPRLTALLASEITPTDLFYRVDINPIPPTVDVNSWQLEVKGLVSQTLTITYEELKAMPSIQQIATLECISNKIGNDLISTAIWNGIRLKDLLEKSKVKPDAKYIVFRCADGYDVGIPLERGFQEGSILAYGMNGEALTTKHGYPVRAIIPGLYGMMNPKWITEIELVGEIYEGYWQKKGWANNAQYNTHSFIVIPGSDPVRKVFRNLGALNIVVGEEIPIAGVAFAGDRGILKVEVSSDGGATWKEARIKDPLSPYTWVLWATELNVTTKGNYKIVVRATDKTGKIQTSEVRDPFPNGAMGYHLVNAQASS